MIVIVHYKRMDGEYGNLNSDDFNDFWGLHAWEGTATPTEWTRPIKPAGIDSFGVYYVIELAEHAEQLHYVIHRGETKDLPGDCILHVARDGREVWLRNDTAGYVHPFPALDLKELRAYWLSRNTIAWPAVTNPYHTYRLHFDPTAQLSIHGQRLVGGESFELRVASPSLRASPSDDRFPHLSGLPRLCLDQACLEHVPAILKGQIAVSETDLNGRLLNLTALQLPGVLDDLFTYTGPLGVTYAGPVPTLRVWAPTARAVSLHLFADATAPARTVVPMTTDPATGVWSITGDADWTGQFYLYEVTVFVPATGRIERNLVTDPYSICLSANSTRSQIVDLNDTRLKPAGWDTLEKPPLATFADMVIYELHVRDFSMNDPEVPRSLRGTFKAFTLHESYGMRHLRALAGAGLTHIHLLPVFDIATIEERREHQAEPNLDLLNSYAPDSAMQQADVSAIANHDGFNWGYDPYHYTVPEGSYATDPDGPARILEFREMVQALNQCGLRVVMDVVYNHTHAAGQQAMSVLDRIVPGYYHRLNVAGAVEHSTCCPNTATEHAMMEKLMLDSLRTWAVAYKVDAFRFDLMGHHMYANMIKVRDMLHGLTPERDGVDGSRIYVYGEGWNFGEVAFSVRGVNAAQLNMAGTGIGTFNDRLRDAVRGGSFGTPPQEQGYATGLFYAPNTVTWGNLNDQWQRLMWQQDIIRIGLAGNLKSYQLVDRTGATVTGADVGYNNQPAGYTTSPTESITYVAAHDNETLFDAIQVKASGSASLEQRIRMNNLALSLVGFGQGIAFFHAGDDMLRSKSLDRNSYNSGDWFNRLDFTYMSNNWGVGLPPAHENQVHWDSMAPLLRDPALKPGRDAILKAVYAFREILQIRSSSRLFRLGTARAIQQQVRFHNTGPGQLPALIVMSITASPDPAPASDYTLIVVLFNAHVQPQTFQDDAFANKHLRLHPVQADSYDPLVRRATYVNSSGTFNVPGQTTAVFVA